MKSAIFRYNLWACTSFYGFCNQFRFGSKWISSTYSVRRCLLWAFSEANVWKVKKNHTINGNDVTLIKINFFIWFCSQWISHSFSFFLNSNSINPNEWIKWNVFYVLSILQKPIKFPYRITFVITLSGHYIWLAVEIRANISFFVLPNNQLLAIDAFRLSSVEWLNQISARSHILWA